MTINHPAPQGERVQLPAGVNALVFDGGQTLVDELRMWGE